MKIWYNERLDDCMNNLTLGVSVSGYVRTGPEWYGNSVCSPFSRLYLVDSGTGWLRTGEQVLFMEPGKAYLIPPGIRLDFGCEDRLSKLYFHIHLLRPDRYDLLQALDQIYSMELPAGWLEHMKKLQSSRTLFEALLLKQYLFQLMTVFLVQAQIKPEEIPVFSHHVSQAIDYTQRHLSAKLTVAELARHGFLSERHLSNLFRKELGVTPGQYLDDQLMLEAQRRLIQTTDSIGSISEALGFTDQFYFSRKFKKQHGQTPLQYRKNNRT